MPGRMYASALGRAFYDGRMNRLGDRAATPDGIRLLAMDAGQGIVMMDEHWTDDTLNTNRWSIAKDAGATDWAVIAAASVAEGSGYIQGSTGTTGNDGLGIYGHPIWLGDKNCGALFKWRQDVVTGFRLETGFTDPLSDYTLGAENDLDTPSITNGAVTVAVLSIDTGETLATAALLLDGDATYATSKVNLGTWVPTADTWYYFLVQCIGDTVYAAVLDANGNVIVRGSAVAAFEGGTLVQPWFFVATTNTTAKVVRIGRVKVWQDE